MTDGTYKFTDPAWLAEVEAREAAASAGPWISRVTTSQGVSVAFYCIPGLDFSDIGECTWEHMLECDRGFIAHSREDIPRLLAELKAAHAEIRRQAAELEEINRAWGFDMDRIARLEGDQ